MIRVSFSTMRWSIFYRIWSHSRKKASSLPSSARWRRAQGCPPKQSLSNEVYSMQLTFCFLVHHFFKAGRTISITLFISCLPTIVIISWMASSYEHPPSQPAHLYSLPSLLCQGLYFSYKLLGWAKSSESESTWGRGSPFSQSEASIFCQPIAGEEHPARPNPTTPLPFAHPRATYAKFWSFPW